MVRFHEYYQPKDKILTQCREILLSLDYEIDMFSTESYSLTTKSMRVRKTLRRYDYVLFVQITDKVEVHISAKRSIFRSCLLYTSPSPRDRQKSRMPSSA